MGSPGGIDSVAALRDQQPAGVRPHVRKRNDGAVFYVALRRPRFYWRHMLMEWCDRQSRISTWIHTTLTSTQHSEWADNLNSPGFKKLGKTSQCGKRIPFVFYRLEKCLKCQRCCQKRGCCSYNRVHQRNSHPCQEGECHVCQDLLGTEANSLTGSGCTAKFVLLHRAMWSNTSNGIENGWMECTKKTNRKNTTIMLNLTGAETRQSCRRQLQKWGRTWCLTPMSKKQCWYSLNKGQDHRRHWQITKGD